MTTIFDRRFDLDGHSRTGYKLFYLFSSFSTQLNSPSDMRSFSLNGPYGMNISLSTAVGGRFSVTFQNPNKRAKSEPANARARLVTHSIAIPVDNVTIHNSLH
jgi:hypothetical protein